MYGSLHFHLQVCCCGLREMATLTDYFKHVSPEDYIAASFSTRERGISGKKTVEQPVGDQGNAHWN